MLINLWIYRIIAAALAGTDHLYQQMFVLKLKEISYFCPLRALISVTKTPSGVTLWICDTMSDFAECSHPASFPWTKESKLVSAVVTMGKSYIIHHSASPGFCCHGSMAEPARTWRHNNRETAVTGICSNRQERCSCKNGRAAFHCYPYPMSLAGLESRIKTSKNMNVWGRKKKNWLVLQYAHSKCGRAC